jgi:hypothetical protein
MISWRRASCPSFPIDRLEDCPTTLYQAAGASTSCNISSSMPEFVAADLECVCIHPTVKASQLSFPSALPDPLQPCLSQIILPFPGTKSRHPCQEVSRPCNRGTQYQYCVDMSGAFSYHCFIVCAQVSWFPAISAASRSVVFGRWDLFHTAGPQH